MRALFAALLLVPGLVCADEVKLLKAGDPIPVFKFNDQHDKPYPVLADTRLIVFTADKSAGDMINGLLKQRPADFMTQRKMVYIADISAMPGFITNMVALPKMRDYAYRIAIGAESEQTIMLPRAVDNVTVIKMDTGKVVSVQQFKETEVSQLDATLNEAPVTPATSKP